MYITVGAIVLYWFAIWGVLNLWFIDKKRYDYEAQATLFFWYFTFAAVGITVLGWLTNCLATSTTLLSSGYLLGGFGYWLITIAHRNQRLAPTPLPAKFADVCFQQLTLYSLFVLLARLYDSLAVGIFPLGFVGLHGPIIWFKNLSPLNKAKFFGAVFVGGCILALLYRYLGNLGLLLGIGSHFSFYYLMRVYNSDTSLKTMLFRTPANWWLLQLRTVRTALAKLRARLRFRL